MGSTKTAVQHLHFASLHLYKLKFLFAVEGLLLCHSYLFLHHEEVLLVCADAFVELAPLSCRPAV